MCVFPRLPVNPMYVVYLVTNALNLVTEQAASTAPASHRFKSNGAHRALGGLAPARKLSTLLETSSKCFRNCTYPLASAWDSILERNEEGILLFSKSPRFMTQSESESELGIRLRQHCFK